MELKVQLGFKPKFSIRKINFIFYWCNCFSEKFLKLFFGRNGFNRSEYFFFTLFFLISFRI
ncbi:MAG: hypothetical protein A2096_08305 [Spirochaetes bacterium GWF1_41_5]|nr:MAG: hypothetical protein A2096_08305 [Spirochaetes bacterium GWF1_41_5]HBE02889.1 hypothetical protein [Spirochaetia bacterium]